MVKFTINMEISSAGLTKIFRSRQFVALARSVDAFVQSNDEKESKSLSRGHISGITVPWLAFEPFMKNSITWTDNCGLYATTTLPAAGHVIVVNSQTNAQPGQVFTFKDGSFSLSSTEGGSYYQAVNHQQNDGLSFGLLAQGSVNGSSVTAPLNIQPMLLNECGLFAPTQTITIFLSNIGDPVSMIPAISGGLLVTLGSASATVKIGFNDQTNQFFLK